MKSIFFSLCILASFATASAQDGPAIAAVTSASATPAATAAVQFRLLPQLPNAVSFEEYLAHHVTYPTVAEENSIEGTVIIAVDVAATGQITGRRVVRSAHALLDAAALDSVKDLRRMLPAVENGEPIARTVNLPVRFSLR